MEPTPGIPRKVHLQAVGRERLESWKEIAAYLRRDVSTVRRWERSKGLPVHRVAGGQRDTIYALRSEIDEWWAGKPAQAGLIEERRRFGKAVWVGLAVAVCVGAAGLALLVRMGAGRGTAAKARITPLMTQPGRKLFPALSPDGNWVAFTWNGEKQDNYDVYVKRLDGESRPIRMTTDEAMELWPCWSPDSRQLLFARWKLGAPKAEYFVTPAGGGTERKVGETFVPLQPRLLTPLGAWVADGNAVILPQAKTPGGEFELTRTDLGTLESRPLAAGRQAGESDCCAAISPDGGRLAFVRSGRDGIAKLRIASVEPRGTGTMRESRALTQESGGAWNPVWSSDGESLLYITNSDGGTAIWRMPAAGGAAEVVRPLGEYGENLSISAQGVRIAYSTFFADEDIWAVDASGGAKPERLIASTLTDRGPAVAPDGKRIAFVSTRSGAARIWISDEQGGNARDLAPAAHTLAAAPRWSPDGREIVFECRYGENEDICAVGAEGGAMRRLTDRPSRELLPSYSQDGQFVYFTTDREDGFRTWKAPRRGEDGGHPAVAVTRSVAFGAVESGDGRYLYYAKGRLDSRVARMRLPGGAEELAGGNVESRRRAQNFVPAAGGSYSAHSTDPQSWFEIRFTPWEGGASSVLLRMQRALGNGMSLTPDGRRLLFSAAEMRGGDLMLLEEVRRGAR